MENKTLWFRAKRYGYGWYPVTWQGWAIIALYVVGLLGSVYTFNPSFEHQDTVPVGFLVQVVVLTIFLISICAAKGEKAKWRWGGK